MQRWGNVLLATVAGTQGRLTAAYPANSQGWTGGRSGGPGRGRDLNRLVSRGSVFFTFDPLFKGEERRCSAGGNVLLATVAGTQGRIDGGVSSQPSGLDRRPIGWARAETRSKPAGWPWVVSPSSFAKASAYAKASAFARSFGATRRRTGTFDPLPRGEERRCEAQGTLFGDGSKRRERRVAYGVPDRLFWWFV